MIRRALVLVGLLGLGGCLDEAVVRCADGSLCSTDLACAPAGGCIEPELLGQCGPDDDGVACAYLGGADGVCREEVCVAAGCGNFVIEPSRGEVCDDGNQVGGDACNATCSSTGDCGNGQVDPGEECDCGNDAGGLPAGCPAANGDTVEAACSSTCTAHRCGNLTVDPRERCDDGNLIDADGCSSDCRSDETCGNGVPDFLLAEQCDDGNLRSQDGCSSGCRVETWRLTQATPNETPDVGSATGSMAYDASRGELLLYVSDSQTSSETWTFDGVGWQRRDDATAPPPRYSPALAYDAARGEVVMFGGYAGNNLRETWTWDGHDWMQHLIPAAASPPNPGYTLLTYDAVHGHVLCFTGGSWNEISQLWAWDGSDWSQLATGGPPGAYPDAFAYDPRRGRAVLFGGYNQQAGVQRVWEWDGVAWAEVTVAVGPGLEHDDIATFDAALGEIVVLHDSPSYSAWAWNGTRWLELASPAPLTTNLTSFAHDPRRGVSVGVGSYVAGSAVWTFDAAGWQQFTPVIPSVPYEGVTLVTVPWSGAVLALANRTYAWSGAGWTQQSTSSPGGYQEVLVADQARARVLAIGDQGSVARLDGSTWTTVTPGDYELGIGYGASVVYDAARQQVVMFGGNQSAGATYRLGGDDAWVEVAGPEVGPSPRFNATMGYDPIRERVVLFGGYPTSPPFDTLGDTWEWDGTSWLARTPLESPLPRTGASMVFDPAAGALVLVGGGADNYLWTWDGETWTSRALAGATLASVRAAYDPRRRELLLTRYVTFPDDELEVFRLRLEADDADETCLAATIDGDHDGLAGCDDLDCRAVCAPGCVLDDCSAATPRCGDGACGAAEDCAICPDDCGACAPVCGNGWCEVDEDCLGDCSP